MKTLTDEIRLQLFKNNIEQFAESIDEKGVIISYNITYGDNIFAIRTESGSAYSYEYKKLTLLKRSLSSLTDKEAKEISEFTIMDYNPADDPEYFYDLESLIEEINDVISGNSNLFSNEVIYLYQYLHFKGFALPFLDWTADELIDQGVYKIID